MRGLCQFLVGLLLLATLAGCGFVPQEERAAWRGDAERRCLAAGYVRASPYILAMREIDGPRSCGMDHPFKVSAVNAGALAIKPAVVMACPAIAHFDAWLRDKVQPAAMAYFGQPVRTVLVMGAYSCRNINGARRGKISEHAFGNAIDIGGFELADGRVVKVVSGWRGSLDEQGFLKRVYADACDEFTTVLAPGSNAFHYNHIHLDLARHDARGLKHYCRPRLGPIPPPGMLPGQMQEPLVSQAPAPPLPQEMPPIARALADQPPPFSRALRQAPVPEAPLPEAPVPEDPYAVSSGSGGAGQPDPYGQPTARTYTQPAPGGYPPASGYARPPSAYYGQPAQRQGAPPVNPGDLDLKEPLMPAASETWPQQAGEAEE